MSTALIEDIINRLFVNGMGERATRLELRQGETVEQDRGLGGYSELAARRQIALAIAEHCEPPTGTLEAKVRELCESAYWLAGQSPPGVHEAEWHNLTRLVEGVRDHLSRLTKDFGPEFLSELSKRNEERKKAWELPSDEIINEMRQSCSDIDALLIFCDQLMLRDQ